MKAFSARRDQAVANEFLADHGKCHKCGATTPNETLANLGAQCHPCFAAYCAEANSTVPPPRTPAERKVVLQRLARSAGGISRNHAAERVKALRNLEASGKALGPGQRWVLACCEAKLGIELDGSPIAGADAGDM